MATFTNSNLTIDNFMRPISYRTGKGTSVKTNYLENFYDNKLRFLNQGYKCTVYTVQQKTFLPNLSVRMYGTSSLWWVIARFNGIIYPLSEIQVGTRLYIPNLSEISKEINKSDVTDQTSAQQKVLL